MTGTRDKAQETENTSILDRRLIDLIIFRYYEYIKKWKKLRLYIQHFCT